jgi:hypothetical protein
MSNREIGEGAPRTEAPSQKDTGPDSPVTITTGTENDNPEAIQLARADQQPPSLIFSDVSPVVLVASGDKRLTGAALRVIINLAGRAGKDRESWPNVGRIARDTGLSPRTVHKAFVALSDCGYVRTRKRFMKHQQRSSQRELCIPAVLPADHPYAPWAREGVNPEPGKGWPSVQGGGEQAGTPRGEPRFRQKYSIELPPTGPPPTVGTPAVTPPRRTRGDSASSPLRGSRRLYSRPHTQDEITAFLANGVAQEQERKRQQEQERDEERTG